MSRVRDDMNKKLFKILMKLLPAAILIPSIICVILASKVSSLQRSIEGREALDELGYRESRLVQLSWYDLNAGEVSDLEDISESVDPSMGDDPVSYDRFSENELAGVYDTKVPQGGLMYASDSEWDGIHRVYLTFDDGPSIYTDDILDILDEYGVKATFFVIGKENAASYSRYLRIVREGHTLGMHSFNHVYSEVYASKDAFIADTARLSDLLEDVTGVKPAFYRFPGGSSNDVSATDMRELADYLTSQGIVYYDWNVSSGDAGKIPLSSDQIVRNALNGIQSRESTVILMHDSATKYSTVKALPRIIEQLQSMDNVEILPITSDTVPIQHTIY